MYKNLTWFLAILYIGTMVKKPWYMTTIGTHHRNQNSRGIKRLRLRAGMTQEKLAWNLGTNRRTLASWEAGRTEPTLSEARMMAEILKIPLSAIPSCFVTSPFDPPVETPKMIRQEQRRRYLEGRGD